jgi:hypothetical protein
LFPASTGQRAAISRRSGAILDRLPCISYMPRGVAG